MVTPADSASSSALSEPPANRRRLFWGSCIALIATSVAFATVGAVMLALKREFVLTNTEVGWIGGAALWGFAVSQGIFAPLCDKLGFRFLLRGAFVAHLAGVLLMITAGGFWMLFFGALVIAMANGLVEAACNPLVATLYPEKKAVRLNQFHVWFPGGIVIGGVAAFLLDQVGVGFWELKLALILVPTVLYGVIMLFEHFPDTENVQAGVSVGEMFRATFLTPLMWLMLLAMIITASTELGPNRWIPPILEAGLSEAGFVGVGVLVLAWINGIMAVLRYNSEATVGRLSPTLVLLLSTVVAVIGLLWLSFAESTLAVFLAATTFAVGVAYYWPTMLGFVSERIPRSGALGLGLMGAVGMAFVGLVTTPQMGAIIDEYASQQMPPEATARVFQQVQETYPPLARQADEDLRNDIQRAAEAASRALRTYQRTAALPEVQTANALRSIVDSQTAVAEAGGDASATAERAAQILNEAENYGGRVAFRYIVPFTSLLLVIFGFLYWRDRKAGGYRIKRIGDDEDGRPEAPSKADREEAQAAARATK